MLYTLNIVICIAFKKTSIYILPIKHVIIIKNVTLFCTIHPPINIASILYTCNIASILYFPPDSIISLIPLTNFSLGLINSWRKNRWKVLLLQTEHSIVEYSALSSHLPDQFIHEVAIMLLLSGDYCWSVVMFEVISSSPLLNDTTKKYCNIHTPA